MKIFFSEIHVNHSTSWAALSCKHRWIAECLKEVIESYLPEIGFIINRHTFVYKDMHKVLGNWLVLQSDIISLIWYGIIAIVVNAPKHFKTTCVIFHYATTIT